MDFTGKQPIFFSRPADGSLAAYKDWITDMTRALSGTMEEDITEEEWQEAWKKTWAPATPDNTTTKEEP